MLHCSVPDNQQRLTDGPDYHLPAKPLLQTINDLSWKRFPLKSVNYVSGIMCNATKENGSGMFEEHSDEFEVLTRPPDSSELDRIQHLWDVLDKLASPPDL